MGIKTKKMKREEFQTEIRKIISDMLCNPSNIGIYPTTKCFEELDTLYDKIVEGKDENKQLKPICVIFLKNITTKEAIEKFSSSYSIKTLREDYHVLFMPTEGENDVKVIYEKDIEIRQGDVQGILALEHIEEDKN